MKKKFYTVALGALLLTSCSQDETPLAGEAEAVKMTFTANLSTGMQSRADGEAVVSVDKLICAVFKQETNGDQVSLNGTELIRDTVDVDVTTGKATFTPTLLKSEKYGIVFWAYKEGTNFYNTENLAAITFNPNVDDNVDPEAEGLVAYTSTIKNVSTDSSGDDLKVKLTRPLAQVNAATTENDWNIVEQLDETLAKSTITLTGCCNVYNALSGTYSGEETFTYTINLSKEINLDGTENILLGTGYTFPGSNVTCDIAVKNEEDKDIYTKNIPNLPVSDNYRTNIVPAQTPSGEEGTGNEGGLMTGSVSYEVTITEGYNENNTENKEV